jgi:hypothetical protein
MPRRRLYDLLSTFPVDSRTLLRAVKSSGIKVVYIGRRSGPFITAEDFDQIKEHGIPYYKDKMTKEGIR